VAASGRGHTLVRLVTRLVVVQAAVTAAIGLCYGRRHLGSLLITLALVAGCCLVALAARTGTRAAWGAALAYEAGFFLYGLSRFIVARYAGGTLLALVTAGTLLHPAVARAYSVAPRRHQRRPAPDGQHPFGDAVPDHTAG